MIPVVWSVEEVGYEAMSTSFLYCIEGTDSGWVDCVIEKFPIVAVPRGRGMERNRPVPAYSVRRYGSQRSFGVESIPLYGQFCSHNHIARTVAIVLAVTLK